MNKERIIILGASELQVPAILEAKKLQFETIVVDQDEHAIGKDMADIFYPVSTLDIVALNTIVEKLKPGALFTMATDAPIYAIAKICAKNNLNYLSVEDALCATDKSKMRERLSKFGLPNPEFFVIKNFTDLHQLLNTRNDEMILKPSDSSGSRGINMVSKRTNNLEEIYLETKSFSKNNIVLLEERLIGPEVSVESITINGCTHIIAITDKVTTGIPNFVELGHNIPSMLTEEIQVLIKNIVQRAIEAIGIRNGPSHTELIITGQGPKIVEIGARLGGDFITSHLVPLATGVNIVKQSLLLAMGKHVSLETETLPAAAAIRYLKHKSGVLEELVIPKHMKNIEKFGFSCKKGDFINELSSSAKRVGYVICKRSNAKEAIKACEKFLDEVTFNLGDNT